MPSRCHPTYKYFQQNLRQLGTVCIKMIMYYSPIAFILEILPSLPRGTLLR